MSVRRTNISLLLAVSLLLAAMMAACGPPASGIAVTGPPVAPLGGATQAAPPSDSLPPAVTGALQMWLDNDHVLSRWVSVDGGYYLVEMTFVPTGEHAYVWVSADGTETEFFGMMERASYSGVKDGVYRFWSTMVGDTLVVFPYYLAGSPGVRPERVPFYRVPNAKTYGISKPGLAYELKKVAAADSLGLLFMTTGPDPDGVMAGGGRPPAAQVIEDGRSVTLRFWYVSLAAGTEESIRGFSSDAAQLKSVSCEDGCLELEFDVSWAYSVSLIGEKVEPKAAQGLTPGPEQAHSRSLEGYRLSFLPKPAAHDARASFHDALTTASGLRFGDTVVTAPRLFGEIQEHLLRAFPLQQVPATEMGGSGVEVALQVSGNWLQVIGRYFVGGDDSPSYLKWGEQWYEVDPAFDALLTTASLPDRDSVGETPDDVVQRYVIALFMRDWKSAYSCLASVPDHPMLQDFVKWAEGFREWNVGRQVEGYNVVQPDVAAVSVSAERWGSLEERAKWRETWACVKETGVWKLRWQPAPPFLVASLEQIPLWSDSGVDSLYSIELVSGAVTESTGFEAISAQVRVEMGYVGLVGGTEHGVVINVTSGESGEMDYSVWYAGIAKPPYKFADGQWEVPFGVAARGGNIAGFVRGRRAGGDYSLWTVGPNGPKALATGILETTCPGQDVTALDLLTWDDDRVFAAAFSYKTGRSTVMGFRIR